MQICISLFDNNQIMPPRRSKKNEPKGQPSSQMPSQDDIMHNDKYTCKCGKSYPSSSAFYTHLKNIHPEMPKGTKAKTFMVNNPKANLTELKSGIEIKNIESNDTLTQFTSIASTAFENIGQYIKEFDKRNKTRTLYDNYDDQKMQVNNSQSQQLSQDINIDDNIEGETKINKLLKRIQNWKRQYGLIQIENINESEQFRWIQLNNTRISMIQQLRKYFNLQFAYKIHFSLQLIVSEIKGITENLKRRYEQVLKEIWLDLYPLNEVLYHYVHQWMKLMEQIQ